MSEKSREESGWRWEIPGIFVEYHRSDQDIWHRTRQWFTSAPHL